MPNKPTQFKQGDQVEIDVSASASHQLKGISRLTGRFVEYVQSQGGQWLACVRIDGSNLETFDLTEVSSRECFEISGVIRIYPRI